MSHSLTPTHETEKRRALIALSAASVAAIVLGWIVYMSWSLDSPDAAPHAGIGQIFSTGTNVIVRSVETGLINSYLYFHNGLVNGNTFDLSN